MMNWEILAQTMPEEINGVPIDAAIITSEENCRYISGFHASARVVVVTREIAYLLTDFRYGEAARMQVKDCKVVVYQKLAKSIEEILRRHDIRGVLLEHEHLTLAQADIYETVCKQWNAVPVKDTTLDTLLKEMRAVKTEKEIENIKAAQSITDAAFTHSLDYIDSNKSEREIALELEFFMRKQGAEKIAFDTIVVSGTNGSMCHGVPSDKKIQKGDFITMDFGAVVNGYHSDMTRTVAYGTVSEAQKQVYQTVLQAQLAAIQTATSGIPCNLVDKAARDIIDVNYAGTFGHTTGHAVGLEIHEWPYFAPACQVITKPGMVITVEPGIYLEGKFGVRIEDMVLIQENGCENLTGSSKELLIL